MLFGKLLPREGNFFELFNQHGALHRRGRARLHPADPALRRPGAARQARRARSAHAERQADKITAEVNRLLHKTFITPIDREQIHGLINAHGRHPRPAAGRERDDVALRRAGDERRHPAPRRPERASAASACSTRSRCCRKISQPDVAEAALKTCEEIDRLESDADRVMRSAMSRLFREEKDVRELIKLKAIYELLESITDRCEDVANLIEGIVLENS